MKKSELTQLIENKVKKILESNHIQDKADAINDYAQYAKSKDIDTLVNMYIADCEYGTGPFEPGTLLKDYVIILKKYNIYDKVMKGIRDDANDLDPAGGHGLHSHI